jgi:hypothetical protein
VTRAPHLALACGLALAAATGAAAQESEADRAFAAAFVAAVNGGTEAARAALVHPASRPCITGEPGEWWAEAVARQAKARIPAQHRWTITPVPAAQPPVFAERLSYPLVPTHVLQLDVQDAPYRFRTLLVQLARNGDRWTEVVPCANAEAVAAIRAVKADKARRAERVKTLAASMTPALRERLLGLIKGGERIEASRTYARESGEDLTTAVDVVELLAESAR